MSNFAKESYLGGRAMLGPEVVNGTGEVYVDIPEVLHLDSVEARELAAAITDAADYADARQAEVNA